jgi:hypothetical protein
LASLAALRSAFFAAIFARFSSTLAFAAALRSAAFAWSAVLFSVPLASACSAFLALSGLLVGPSGEGGSADCHGRNKQNKILHLDFPSDKTSSLLSALSAKF